MTKLKTKLKAALIHLLLSMAVFAFVLYYIRYQWYPEPLFTAQGGWQGLRLMTFIQLVLGPTLTFIVFDRLKSRKAIVFDMVVIILLQVSALAFGLYTVYSQRPVALVFWHDAFYTVTADDYTVQGIEHPDFSHYSAYVPPLIYSRPLNTKQELERFNALTEKKIPVYAHVSLYEKIDNYLDAIFKHEVDIDEVMSKNAVMKARLNEIVQGDFSAYHYLALNAKYHNMILVLDDKGTLVGEVKAPYM